MALYFSKVLDIFIFSFSKVRQLSPPPPGIFVLVMAAVAPPVEQIRPLLGTSSQPNPFMKVKGMSAHIMYIVTKRR